MQSFDCIVIGVGGMGSAACYELARRGVRVLGLEQFSVGHDRGSSHGETRIIRKAYFEHPDYVPLLHTAYRLWAELEEATEQKLYTRTGLLMAGPEDCETIVGVRRAAREHSLAIESLTPSEARRRFPTVAIPDDTAVLFEPDAGLLAVEHCVRVAAAAAIAHGATIRCGIAVRSWRTDAKGVTVETTDGAFHAAKLVITAGAWSAALLGDLGVPLRVLRKVQLWLGTIDPRNRLEAGFPVFCFESGGFFYGFPSLDGASMKIAEHSGEEVVESPSMLNRAFARADAERVQSFAQRHLLGVTTEVQRHATCMYTMSPDGHFIIDRDPRHEHVTFAAGFSGHGFKFASLVGSVLADVAMDGRTSEPIGFLGLSRFR